MKLFKIQKYNINLNMISKREAQYRDNIRKAITERLLIIGDKKQGKKSNLKLQYNQTLQVLYHKFSTSQEIQNNSFIQQTDVYNKQVSKEPINNRIYDFSIPYLCVGLVIGQYQEIKNKIYVYGTGVLIHNNIVLTSAQNLYCKRLKKQYANIKFIPGLINNQYSGVYASKKINYPKEYTEMQEDYDKYNFAIIQLEDDLSEKYNYVGLKISHKFQNVYLLGYAQLNKDSFVHFYSNLQCRITSQSLHYPQIGVDQCISGSPLLVIDQDNYYVVGIHTTLSKQRSGIYLTNEVKNIINGWTKIIQLNLSRKSKLKWDMCKPIYDCQIHDLNYLNLDNNNINDQGCKHITSVNWIHMTEIYLSNNEISAQGCKYIQQANWPQLSVIDLSKNLIGDQGCKHISQAYWRYLIKLYLTSCQIGDQGCKYLIQANWSHLMKIQLGSNQITNQGCRYLKDAKWSNLSGMNLYRTKIDNAGYKYLKDAMWQLRSFYLCKLGQTQIDKDSLEWPSCYINSI